MADEFEIQLALETARTPCPPAELDELETCAHAMVARVDLEEGLAQPFELCLRLASDDEVRNLNRDFRGHDKSTDVLAFALREAPGGEAAPHLLGDIIISVETAARQAKHGLAAELCFLFAHGLCHLLGYDHHTDAEETAMNARCRVLLEAVGFTPMSASALFDRSSE